MPHDDIMSTQVDLFQEISRVLLLIMYALAAKAVSSYHYVKDKYLEYKYASDDVSPMDMYFLTHDGSDEVVLPSDVVVPEGFVYIEEWVNTKGHKKMIVKYEGEEIPKEWKKSPFDKPHAKCPWVWVGDKETEIDLTRTFDRFLVPGNVLKEELVSKLIKITNHTNLVYIETRTFNQIKFPGDGITIEADVD